VGARNHNYRLVKIHRNYSIEEIASLLDVHRNTVRRWLDEGLATIDRRRPLLVKGTVLQAFLRDRRAKNKCPCAPGEFYCLRCRHPKRPIASRVVYEALTFDRGNLLGICPDCGARLNRRVSLARMAGAIGDLHVTYPQVQEHIDESSHPSLNCDFSQDARNHA
jgi:hypothetical protein